VTGEHDPDAPDASASAPATPEETQQAASPATGAGVSRRRLFSTAAGTAVAGALVGAGGTAAALSGGDRPSIATAAGDVDIDLNRTVPFYDQPHQAGIRTTPQRHAVFATFTLADSATKADLQTLLARWTAAIGQLTGGKAVGQVEPTRPDALGGDTGEAHGLFPASLTVTVGLGPSIFGDRFGLGSFRPRALTELPRIPGDALEPGLTGGDLSVQACADDPQVAYHAVHNLARMAATVARTHWMVLGFGRASAGPGQQTPRNLMGFKDGTRNVNGDAEFDRFVWADDGDWFAGGTYQVARKIRITMETWDATNIANQQETFGRTKDEGAPLSGKVEGDTPDFTATGGDGNQLISPYSHVSMASPENNGGTKILRRAYNYTDGLNAQGLLDAGLMFLAYMNDPQHFVDLQTRLGRFDLLNEYIRHIGSAVFAVPPAPKTGAYLAQALFE
jgi:deferrochelatase/peroxidase EfeB